MRSNSEKNSLSAFLKKLYKNAVCALENAKKNADLKGVLLTEYQPYINAIGVVDECEKKILSLHGV